MPPMPPPVPTPMDVNAIITVYTTPCIFMMSFAFKCTVCMLMLLPQYKYRQTFTGN